MVGLSFYGPIQAVIMAFNSTLLISYSVIGRIWL